MLINTFATASIIFNIISKVISKAVFDNSSFIDHHAAFENIQDLKVLRELPLNKLLKVKSSIHDFSDNEVDSPNYFHDIKDLTYPEAMALSTDAEDPPRRTDLKKGKGGKVNTLLMLSITTLAFLAFGGYLLCLIVQAVKGKNEAYNNQLGMATQSVMLMSGSVKKKKPQFNYGRRKRDIWDDTDPAQMYKVLIMMAEGYATWYQIK